MLSAVNRAILIAMFIVPSNITIGQEETPAAAWLLPGASWHPSKDVRLVGQLGYNHYFKIGIFYPQTYITVYKHIVLNPAYIYAIQKKESDTTVREHYLMNSIIFQTSKNNFIIDDRNMLWNRFTVNSKSRHYYRNRLRVTQSFKVGSVTTRLYGYDEVFLLFNQKAIITYW